MYIFYKKNLELALKYTQQSLELSRDFSTAANVASSLSNIALVQLQLGRPKDALITLEEAVTIVRGVSRNYLAAFWLIKPRFFVSWEICRSKGVFFWGW
ncbi:MAG: tetratricopeptide repeat protein [Chloroflexi bacterium]|nr:tetratricopeptide repeat protein [Chloroflexota bacterium]